MTIDRRVLGAVRIAYGLVLLYDVIRRFRVREVYYSNAGILSNHYLLFQPEDHPQFSLLTAFSTPAEVTVAFVGIGFVYVCYALGLFTRVMRILVLVCLTSLNARNLFAEDGGVSTLIALGLWTAFLPMSDRFALDAVVRQARLPSLVARVRARKRLKKPVVSLAVLALVLQIMAIYWLNAVQKTGATWRHGEAVHYVLWQERVNTAFAWWLAHHEPSWFSPLASRGTIIVETLIPLLIVYPYGRWARTLGFGLSAALHLGIAAVMSLGPFSYAMVALVLSRLPEETLVGAAARLPLAFRRRVQRWRAQAIAAVAPRVARGPAPKPARRPLPWKSLREASVGVLLLALATELTQANPGIHLKLPQPAWLHELLFYPRFTQRWLMFAPDAPTDDGTTVIDAVTADGRHLDPFTGVAPDFDALDRGPLPHPIEISDYLFQIHFDFSEPYRRELSRYVEHWHERNGTEPTDRFVSYDAWWVSHDTPPPGSVTPGPTQRERFMSARFRPPPRPADAHRAGP
ncbi:MAG TPA: lipase maturation factor family protein [Polyangiaceae bacterium]|nr:lipase maturation factor family protein [Polyangiaceae bacterium]